MYNRYIRDRQGNFTRVPEAAPPEPPAGPPPPAAPPPFGAEEEGLLRRLLGRLNLGHVDTGDLLLLLILFLLFSEGGEKDGELLLALGLLLIL